MAWLAGWQAAEARDKQADHATRPER